MSEQLISYLYDTPIDNGATVEVVPGVYWVRMPLPFKLNHINLWVLEDDDGWIIVDCGIDLPEVRAHWQHLFATTFKGKPLKKIIVTHFHPDHVGLAGWFWETQEIPVTMTLGEWGMARNLKLEDSQSTEPYLREFYKRAGFDDGLLALIPERSVSYPNRISIPPPGFNRIMEGDILSINGNDWQVIIGTGHSPEHACLFCENLNVLISGDQILPRISPNISIWPQEPEADPLSLFLSSLKKFTHLPQDTLVLPSHDTPFRGLHARLEELARHHNERLETTLSLCHRPQTALEVLKGLFERSLDSHQIFFAIGESLAHLHYLRSQGKVMRTFGNDKIYRFLKV